MRARAARVAARSSLSDYQKGVVTRAPDEGGAGAGAARAACPLLVDPKVRHFALYRGVAVVTPNQLEAEQATGVRIRDDGRACGPRASAS